MILVRVQVRPSTIHGLGLFATEFIPAGTPVWRLQPGFDHLFRPEDAASLPAPSREHLRWFGYVRPEDGFIVLSGDHACFMNHQPHPNTGADPKVFHPACTVALRDIAAGEELTCDYLAFDADAGRKLTPPTSAGAV